MRPELPSRAVVSRESSDRPLASNLSPTASADDDDDDDAASHDRWLERATPHGGYHPPAISGAGGPIAGVYPGGTTTAPAAVVDLDAQPFVKRRTPAR